ncbi:hypothetical protein Salat_1228700 [Sesamum alatum]|uniref:Uncharacterized protein n=1 Tax=Sesamum alatum TaxID=300844 RepID=A0AAE1YFL9_9LAMI|nr:hypothetical protein Salat_1228700 [Sesamum alatum]
METEVFDVVKFEKEKAIARFNRFRRIARLWQIFEVVVVFGLISWSSARVPAVLKVAEACFVEFSTYLFNHHVVFLIGNAIIVLLFVLCRQNDTASLSGGGDFYDDYVKHSEAARQPEPAPSETADAAYNPPTEVGGGGSRDEEKQIVVCTEERTAVSQCDDVTAAIEKATRQIRRFQRTQSEKLKREICVRPQPELRRSETQNRRKSVSSGERFDAAEIERLSSEEFRRTVDAFIDKHWCKKKMK